jgi:hypothetical protein
MDSGHPRLFDHGSPVRRNGAPSHSGCGIEKTRTSVPPPPPSERLETTTLTLSNTSVGRGLSRSGTPADSSTRDNGFGGNSRAQSVVQLPTTTALHPHTLQHSHSAPVYTNSLHPHSRSDTPVKETSPPSTSDSRSNESIDPIEGFHTGRNGVAPTEPDVKVESWQRPRNGVHNVDLPPLSTLHAEIGRDEENRRAARRPSWTPHAIPEDSTYPNSAPGNGTSSGAVMNGSVHEYARDNSTHREDGIDQMNGHSAHRQESKMPPHVATKHSHQNHPGVSSNSSTRHTNSTSPENSHAHNHHRIYTHSPRNQPMQGPPSRPSSRSSHVPSSSELEAHYHELQTQKLIWEEIMDKTQRYMEDVRSAIEATREREKNIPSNGHTTSVPLPGRSSSGQKGSGKDRIWSWTTNGPEKEREN